MGIFHYYVSLPEGSPPPNLVIRVLQALVKFRYRIFRENPETWVPKAFAIFLVGFRFSWMNQTFTNGKMAGKSPNNQVYVPSLGAL